MTPLSMVFKPWELPARAVRNHLLPAHPQLLLGRNLVRCAFAASYRHFGVTLEFFLHEFTAKRTILFTASFSSREATIDEQRWPSGIGYSFGVSAGVFETPFEFTVGEPLEMFCRAQQGLESELRERTPTWKATLYGSSDSSEGYQVGSLLEY